MRDDERQPPATALRDGQTVARVPVTTPGADAPGTRVRGAGPAAVSAALEFQAGSVIKGRFELNTLVGRGGMGSVWSAVDRRKIEARDPNPDVAVKILNSSFEAHPDAFIALQREASKAQSLAHPNIVTVFDFDRDGDKVFITMELLRGRSLDQVIRSVRNSGLDRKTALPIIRGFAEGLSYAHRKGIVHSDLKPANVFLLDNGTPKILDFGIARAVPTAAATGPQDQFDAGSLGAYTPGYATDEMEQGADPSPADDIYALGIIVYELLSGRHPYGGKTAAEGRAAGIPPTPIKILRRGEWHVLARALMFERAKRPRDATEFLRVFFGATRLRNTLIAGILLMAVVAGYLWYQNYVQSGPAVAFADLPAATQQELDYDFAEGDKAWAFYSQQGIANALDDSLSYFAKAYALHKRDRTAVRGLRRAADEILKRAHADPSVLQEAARTLAESSEYLNTYPPVVAASGR